jgi:hypothetical protein
MKKLFTLLFLTSLVILSCSKKDDPIACFDDAYNGTYNGTITINQVSSPATIKLTKKGCYDAQIESAANIGDKNINAIAPNGQNGYNGTLVAYGSSISMGLNGNTISIIADSKYSFIGNK